MKKQYVLFSLLALVGAAALAGRVAASGRTAEAPTVGAVQAPGAAGVDPRSGGFEIGLGEWALSPEAKAIRPGRVTFVITNRGRFTHGFELEIRRTGEGREDEGEAETAELRPGQKTTLTMTLSPGRYEIECFVGDHDEMGMRGTLEVREDAPLVAPRPAGGSTVEIANFAFKPATLRTVAGTVVTWRNRDPAPHTATGRQFSSPQLGKGGSYRRRFTRAGTFTYLCAVHPGMRGKVVVAKGGAR